MNGVYETRKISDYLCFPAFIGSLFLLFFLPLRAQDLPKEIRGYKVHKAKISIKNHAEKTPAKDKFEAFVKVGEPELIDVSLAGITFELTAEVDSIAESGTIDFLTFHDFRVNGLKVEVEEYTEKIELKKNQIAALPKPVRIFLSAAQTLRGVIKEARESKEEWTVTGRVFVFGRFKKSFLKFKRVIPVEINLKIKNPLKQAADDELPETSDSRTLPPAVNLCF